MFQFVTFVNRNDHIRYTGFMATDFISRIWPKKVVSMLEKQEARQSTFLFIHHKAESLVKKKSSLLATCSLTSKENISIVHK